MNADINTVKYVGELAAIQLEDSEAEDFAKDLSAIISHMEQLMRIDTDYIQPMEHVLPVFNRFREDVVTNENRRTDLLAVAQKQEEGCFLVPNVVE